jgi:GTP-binding protein
MGEVLAIKSAEFVVSAVRPAQYPAGELPEVAFAGRSNVGKSSLINCLVQRKKLVRTSRTPGQTQMINFFRINGALHFVDLPGYGFARVPEAVRAKWGPMVEEYFAARKNLKGAVQILDARHPPSPEDLKLWSWLSAANLPILPVLTKSDKIGRSKWDAQVNTAASALGIAPGRIILFSAETQQGRQELLEQIVALLGFGEVPEKSSPQPG